MEFFNFEPEEYQVLEEIEVDETIQRPEKVRFYTLEEQLVDATEKLIPRDRRYTRYDLEQIKYEVSRYEVLYNRYIRQSMEGYSVAELEAPAQLDWVHPAFKYSVDSDPLGRYDYALGYLGTTAPSMARIPGYYPRMVGALPVKTFGDGPYPVEITKPTVVMAENPATMVKFVALPAFSHVRTVRHSDQDRTLTMVSLEGTGDQVRINGYRLEKRPVDIPNPNPDHPFFKENADVFVDVSGPLSDVLPSIDAILEHGVPVTRDPYGEGQKYLKVYDVRLDNISWALWRTRFPPVEPVTKTPQVEDIKFAKGPANAPSEKILKAYGAPYFPGVAARHWLSQQPDGGDLIVQALLSDAFTNGSVPAVPGLNLSPLVYPETTLDQCQLTGRLFEEFQTAGVVRLLPNGRFVCVPPEFILQERRQLGYLNRIAFREETPAEILKAHVDALSRYRMPEKAEKEKPEAKTPMRAESTKRKEILAVLGDERRVIEDKVRDIQEILKTGTVLEKQVYSDVEGLFVVCSHTLAVLKGDLAEDRRKFYDDWTAQDEGFRVCRFCGERIVQDDAIDADEYDDSGRRIYKDEAMEAPTFHGGALAGYITGIRAIQALFNLDSPVESTIYTMLTVLHVLPEADKTEHILRISRFFENETFRGAPAGERTNILKGALGIAMSIILLQTHIPVLIPRRSFGSRPLKLDGYPRDEAKTDKYSIVDSMIHVITATYDAFPAAVKGPSASLIRAVLRNSKQIKTAVLKFIDEKMLKQEEVRKLMEQAYKRFAELPPPTPDQIPLIEPVIPSMKLGTVERAGECRSTQVMLASARPPQIQQEEPPLRRGIAFSEGVPIIEPAVSERVPVAEMPTREIIERRKVGVGKLKFEVKDGWRTNLMLASRLADVFEMETALRTVDSRQGPDELRDIAKGYLFEVLKFIQSSDVRRKKFEDMRQKDLTLLMLSANIDLELSAVNRVLARQRKTFVQRMGEKTDLEREIVDELKRRGMAPIIITTEDRELFAAEIENQLRPRVEFAEEEEEIAVAGDDGVGLPQEPDGPEEDAPGRVVDRGDYGDMAPLPVGRDPPAASLTDDAATSV
jgi:hypothetical protein